MLDLRWPARLAGSHLLVDESVAFALAQRDPARRRAAFLPAAGCCSWPGTSAPWAGVLGGKTVGDPGALGLDAASPVVLLALVLPGAA